jgi:AmmeMemoRadiSam system protein B
LLDGPAFRAFADAPVREPVCVGSYEEDPDNLRRQLADLFTRPDGPGLPRDIPPDGGLRAALIPHIDYERGGAGYGWAFKEVVERTEASLFVIIGTSHLSPYRFTLTRKAFRTPLGVTPTDSGFIDRVVAHYGDGLFEDELRAHLPEWSIELEVVLLQFLYERRRPIRIVPLVVGSFHDSIQSGESPSRSEDVARMAEALRQAEAAAPEPVCYLISGDLAHIGPKFGDPGLPGELVTHSREQDQAILQAAAGGDPEAYFRVISDEGDGRRICGLPPTYVTLLAARPSAGRLLHYGQYVHPEGHESVSFASMAFDR